MNNQNFLASNGAVINLKKNIQFLIKKFNFLLFILLILILSP